jgi:hypothetical protein
MLTRENKLGLVLAFLLGLSDVAFLAALSGDSSDKPPVAIAVLSALVGLATVVLVVLAWRAPTWPLMITIVGLRVLAAVGDIPGLFQTAEIVTVSVVHLVISLTCLGLLRNWMQRPAESPAARTGAGAAN